MCNPSTLIFLISLDFVIVLRGCDARSCSYDELSKCTYLYHLPFWRPDQRICNGVLSIINCVEKVNQACKSDPYDSYTKEGYFRSKQYIYGSKVILTQGIEKSTRFQEQFKLWGCVAPTCSYSEIEKCDQLHQNLPVQTSSEERCKYLSSSYSCLHNINEDCESSPYATSTLRTKGNETLELIQQKIHNWGCVNVNDGGIGQKCK